MGKPKYAEATDKGRFYHHPSTGEMWISVTNAIDAAINKPALVPWAAKVTATAMWDRLPDAVRVSMNGTAARDQFMREVKGQVRFVKDSAADLGTRVHSAAEHLALGTVAPEDEEAAPYAAQALAFFERFQIDPDKDIEASEATVIHRTAADGIGYAGTADIWCHIRLSPEGVWTPRKRWLWCCDYKSSATRPVASHYPEGQLQLAALAAAPTLLLDNGTEIDAPGPVAGTALLNLRTDCFGFIPMPPDRASAFAAFESAVRIATWLHANSAKLSICDGSPAKGGT